MTSSSRCPKPERGGRRARRSLALLVVVSSLACANPVRVEIQRPAPDPERARLERAAPSELLAASVGADPETIALTTAVLIARLPEERDAFVAAGLRLPEREPGERWIDASTVDVAEGLATRFTRAGIGTPISIEAAPRAPASASAKFPPEGHFAAGTALLTARPGCSALHVADPRRYARVMRDGRTAPLAADWTAPYARLLASTTLLSTGRSALLRPFRAERSGLFLLEPYDPAKSPLVMVHGLGSSPMAWRELTNAVFGDPTLRARFQVWHYFYPTGTPYLWAGRAFRRTLSDAIDELARDERDLSRSDVVLVGHSMGGMLVKTAVSNTGGALWDLVFRVPPDALSVSDADRATLLEVFEFERLESVSRAIFVMSPHRGSDTAQSPIGRFGDWLVGLPRAFTTLFERLVRIDPDALRPAFRRLFEEGAPSSIRALRSDHPLFPTLAEIPIDPDVPFHSIIGDVGDGSDGVVSRDSAWLDGAASTITVAAGHRELESPIVNDAILTELRRHAASTASGSDAAVFDAASCTPGA